MKEQLNETKDTGKKKMHSKIWNILFILPSDLQLFIVNTMDWAPYVPHKPWNTERHILTIPALC